MKCKSWTRTSIKITSYHGTDPGSSREKPDEVKMVLYSWGVWNALFSLAVFTKRQMSIRTAEVRLFIYFFLCFGRGMSVARCDHGGGLALSESSWGYCRSWYDAEITRNRQWRQRITEDLPDASKMYDWNYFQDLFKRASLCNFHLAFSPSILLRFRWCSHSVVLTWLQRGRIPILFYQKVQISIWSLTSH